MTIRESLEAIRRHTIGENIMWSLWQNEFLHIGGSCGVIK
jgi:hypothetical protein